MRPVRLAALVISAFFSSALVASAQITNVNDATSTPTPGVGHDYIKMLNETVNPANGSVSLRVEAPVPKGRGPTMPFSFDYDSNGALTPVIANKEPNYGDPIMQNYYDSFSLDGWYYGLPRINFINLVMSQRTQGAPECDASTGTGFQLLDHLGFFGVDDQANNRHNARLGARNDLPDRILPTRQSTRRPFTTFTRPTRGRSPWNRRSSITTRMATPCERSRRLGMTNTSLSRRKLRSTTARSLKSPTITAMEAW